MPHLQGAVMTQLWVIIIMRNYSLSVTVIFETELGNLNVYMKSFSV